MKFDLSVSDGQIYLVLDDVTLTGAVVAQSSCQGSLWDRGSGIRKPFE